MPSLLVNAVEWVIPYGRITLTKDERWFCITRCELLAVVHFCKTYRLYLSGA